MKIKAFFSIMIISLTGIFLLDAQDSGREVTVEELYLRNIEVQILREQAYSDDREMKLLALDDFEEMIGSGSHDARVVQPVLEYLAMEGIGRKVRESNRLINYFPEVRRRAANLLGRLGGEQAKNTLITVLINDDEPMVKAEAAYALGVIGLNENNDAVNALNFTLGKEDPDQPDNNFAYAICLAIEKIAAKNNGKLDPIAYRTLVRIAQGSYIKTVKRKALQSLNELKKYD